MKKIANIAALIFIFAVVILGIVSIAGIWNFFANDVITKSFQSIGLLGFVAVIILVADHFMNPREVKVPSDPSDGTQLVSQSDLMFKSIRTATLTILIVAVSLLALIGILSIWQVLSSDVLHKSVASISIVAFSSFIIVLTCLERESNSILYRKKMSGGMVLLGIIILWILIVAVSGFIFN